MPELRDPSEVLVPGVEQDLVRIVRRCPDDHGWQKLSLEICAALAAPVEFLTRVPLRDSLKWIQERVDFLLTTFEGHRLVEAAVKGHPERMAECVAQAFLLKEVRVNVFSCRVASTLFRSTCHEGAVAECARALALSSEKVWRRGGIRSRNTVYVLTTLVAQSSHAEVASTIVRLWFRPDALQKLLMKTTCYLQLLAACLRSCAPERPRLVALLLCSFEESPDLRYVILKSIACTPQYVGADVLCALAAASEEIFGIKFPELLTGFALCTTVFVFVPLFFHLVHAGAVGAISQASSTTLKGTTPV